jgi:hypothetical protein
MMRTTYMLLPALLLLVSCGGQPLSLEVQDLEAGQIAFYPADGGVVVKGRFGVCVVPPLDGLAELAGQAEGEPGGDEGVDAVLYLQLGMYRLCELKINQNLSAKEHRALVRRLIASTNRLLKSRVARAEARTAEAEARKALADARKAEVQAGAPRSDELAADAGPEEQLISSPYDD